jgi:hypothetical protein
MIPVSPIKPVIPIDYSIYALQKSPTSEGDEEERIGPISNDHNL